MGGGNQLKSKMARDKAASKAPKSKTPATNKPNAATMSMLCQVCRKTWLSSVNTADLLQHHENKHGKLPISQCFPHLGADAAPAADAATFFSF